MEALRGTLFEVSLKLLWVENRLYIIDIEKEG